MLGFESPSSLELVWLRAELFPIGAAAIIVIRGWSLTPSRRLRRVSSWIWCLVCESDSFFNLRQLIHLIMAVNYFL